MTSAFVSGRSRKSQYVACGTRATSTPRAAAGDSASGIRAMAEEPPRGDPPPASGDADARTRVSLVSLGSSIAEDISADMSEVPLDATREFTESGLLDASALAPASLDVTRESAGSGPAFDAGFFDDAGTATPLFASPRVHYDPHCGVPPPADTAKHGRRAGVPRPPAAGSAPAYDATRPPLSPPAATPSSARAQALASSYSGSKPSRPSETRGSAAEASLQKTPADASTRRGGPVYAPPGSAGAPQEADSSGLPPTPAGAFVTPAHAPGGPAAAPARGESARTKDESPLGSAGFDSDEELSPSSCASVPEPTARAPRARPERGDPARSSATPPAPREKVPTPSLATAAEPERVDADADAAEAETAPSDDEAEEEEEAPEDVRASSDAAATAPVEAEPAGQPWQLEPVTVAGATLLLDPETRQTFLPPEQSSRDGRLPTFCGRFAVDGKFSPHRPLCDFFDAAKRFCQTRRVSVAELFRLYDDSAKLPFARFAKLVRECLSPAVSAAELAYTHAMLDLDGRGEVSPANVEACVREMAMAGDDWSLNATEPEETSVTRFTFFPDCAPRATAPSLASFLERVAETAVERNGGSVAALFASCAPKTSWTGAEGLDAFGVLKLIEKAFPGMIRADARVVLAAARALDLDNDGLVSLQELRRGVRLAATARVVPGEGFGKPLDAPFRDFEREKRSARVRVPRVPGTKAKPKRLAEPAERAAKQANKENEKNAASGETVPTRRSGKTRETNRGSPSRAAASGRLRPDIASRAVTPSPMKKREELALRKRLRAARVRADKKVARGELVESDVREEIARVEETLRAAAYERKLAARRAELAAASNDEHLDAETRAFREAQLAAFDAARAEEQEDEWRRRRDAARRDAFIFSGDSDGSNALEITEALWSKWREEEAYAMVETYGKEEVLTALTELAARKDDATGAFRSEEVDRVSAALRDLLSSEDEARALELVEHAKEQARARRAAAEAAAREEAEALAKAEFEAKERKRLAFEKEERARRYGDEYDADLRLERLRHDRISSEWTGGVEATPPVATRSEKMAAHVTGLSPLEMESIGGEDAAREDDGSYGETSDVGEEPDSVFPSLFSGYPASPATIGRSPRRFVVDGEPRYAVEDRSFEKPMFLPLKNAPADR